MDYPSGRLTPVQQHDPTLALSVIVEACRIRRINPSDIMRRTRLRHIARTRFAIMWVLRQHGLTLMEIARMVGVKDHTSVIHGVREAERLMEAEDERIVLLCHYLLEFSYGLLAKGAANG